MASDTSTSPITVDIHPQGNVVLICGSQYGDGKTTSLRVSASVLSLGSPVFMAMFKPHFKEGTDLLERPDGVPLEVKLPEDDPMAMQVICNIMHLRNDRVAKPKTWQPADMLRVAQAADKYHCIVALQPTTKLWLEVTWPYGTSQTFTEQKTHELFATAYLVKDEEAFKKFGRDLVLHSRGFITKKAHFGGEKDLVGIFLIALERQRIDLERRIIDFTEGQLLQRSDLRKTLTDYQCSMGCTWVDQLTNTHLQHLKSVSLFPSSKMRQMTLSDSITNLRGVGRPRLIGGFGNMFNNTATACLGSNCISKSVRMTTTETYNSFTTVIQAEIVGPCLECYRGSGRVKIKKCEHATSTPNFDGFFG